MEDNSNSDVTENIEIFSTDHQKIKLAGEILSNESSREILQILFDEELTANEIAQKTGISLQLVKYHVEKMQELGIIIISKTEKNSKSHDMKYYKAKKFAIVIVPSKITERVKESKSLARSFKTIYKFVGVGVAVVASLFSITLLQKESTISPPVSEPPLPYGDSGYVGNVPQSGTLEETLELARRKIEAASANPTSGSGIPYLDSSTFFEIMIIIAIVGTVISTILFWKAYSHSKKILSKDPKSKLHHRDSCKENIKTSPESNN